MIKSAETLETQKVELAAQLEKIYEEQAVIKEAMAKEHKNHKYMQGKLDIIEANVEKFKVQEKYLKNLIEITNENQEFTSPLADEWQISHRIFNQNIVGQRLQKKKILFERDA